MSITIVFCSLFRSQWNRRGKRRVTRMVVAVVLGMHKTLLISSSLSTYLCSILHLQKAFAVCWLPIQIILVLKSINLYHQTAFLVGFQITSHVLAYLSSCVNPLLYAFLSENFRKAFRKVSSKFLSLFCIECSNQFHLFPTEYLRRSSDAGYSTALNLRSQRKSPGHQQTDTIMIFCRLPRFH